MRKFIKTVFLLLALLLLILLPALFFFREQVFVYVFKRMYGDALKARPQTPFGDFITRVLYNGDFAYAGTTTNLLLFDAHVPAPLSLIKKIPLPSAVMGIHEEKNALLVVLRNGSVVAIDAARKKEAFITGEVTFPFFSPRETNASAAADGYVYLATSKGLVVVDARDKTKLSIVKEMPLGALNSMTKEGNLLYAAQAKKGLLILDRTNPASPSVTGQLLLYQPAKNKPEPSPAPPMDVIVLKNTAYAANGHLGVAVVDVSDPENPKLIRHILPGRFCDGLYRAGKYVAARSLPRETAFFDVTKPESPVFVKSTPPLPFFPISFHGEKAVSAVTPQRIALLDMRRPLSPKTLSAYSLAKPAVTDVKADEYFVYAASGSRGVEIYRRQPPENPVLLSAVKTGSMAVKVEVYNGHVFAANGAQGGIDVIDATHPDYPVLKTAFHYEQMVTDFSIYNGTAFVSAAEDGLSLYDVRVPAKPVFLSSSRVFQENKEPFPLIRVFKERDVFFFTSLFNGFLVSRLERYKPILIARVSVDAADVVFRGNAAYAAGFEKGVHVLDVRDKKNIKRIAALPTAGLVLSLDAEGDFLYAADAKKGVFVYDIRLPLKPAPSAVYATRGTPRAVSAVGNFVYIADGEAGLAALNTTTGELHYADDNEP